MTGDFVDFDKLPYRLCVGIAVFNQEGKVWAGRRYTGGSYKDGDQEKLWQLPQGGIEKGERPLDAAYRELWEETGIRSVQLFGEIEEWISYDFSANLLGVVLGGKYRGQKQKWFAMGFTGNIDEIAINPPPGGNAIEFDSWKWMNLEEIPDMVVSFKRTVYEKISVKFRNFA